MIKSCRYISICLPCSGCSVPWSPLPWEPSFTCPHFSGHSCNHILDLVTTENRSTSKIYHFLVWSLPFLFCHFSLVLLSLSVTFFFFLFGFYFLNLHFLLLNIPIKTDLAQVISLFLYGQLFESSSGFPGIWREEFSLTMAVRETRTDYGSPKLKSVIWFWFPFSKLTRPFSAIPNLLNQGFFFPLEPSAWKQTHFLIFHMLPNIDMPVSCPATTLFWGSTPSTAPNETASLYVPPTPTLAY